MKFYSDEIKKFAESRETSDEIVEAIFFLENTPSGRHRVWESPTALEREKIITMAHSIADDPHERIHWGCEYIDHGK